MFLISLKVFSKRLDEALQKKKNFKQFAWKMRELYLLKKMSMQARSGDRHRIGREFLSGVYDTLTSREWQLKFIGLV